MLKVRLTIKTKCWISTRRNEFCYNGTSTTNIWDQDHKNPTNIWDQDHKNPKVWAWFHLVWFISQVEIELNIKLLILRLR